jgi:hypothetical protein
LEILLKPIQYSRQQLDLEAKNLAAYAEQLVQTAKYVNVAFFRVVFYISSRNTALVGRQPNVSIMNSARAVSESMKNILAIADLISSDPSQAVVLKDALELSMVSAMIIRVPYSCIGTIRSWNSFSQGIHCRSNLGHKFTGIWDSANYFDVIGWKGSRVGIRKDCCTVSGKTSIPS